MKTIFKYPLVITDRQEIEMPKAAKILAVDTQAETLCLWAIVNPEMEKERRVFRILGTGHSMPNENLFYIGTAQMASGRLMWHVFEITD